MPLQFAAIPESVAHTVERLLGEDSENIALCFYGADADLSNIIADNFIAWGCDSQLPSHRSLSKACPVTQLEAELQAIISRQQPAPIPLWNGWGIDITRKQLIRDGGESLDLTDKEVELLRFFMSHPNKAIEKSPLLAAVWGYDDVIDTRTLETHIYRLRQKLEAAQAPSDCGIITKDDGYCWQV